MARAFSNDADNYLTKEGIPTPAYPMTMACWHAAPAASSHDTLFSISDKSADEEYWAMQCERTATTVRCRELVASGGTSSQVARTSSVSHSAGQWHHFALTIVATNERHVWIDGGDKDSDTFVTIALTLGDLDNYTIGLERVVDNSPLGPGPLDGDIAEVGLWDVELTDADVAALGAGMSPLMVRPEGLIGYWPLHGRYGRA